MALPCVWLFGSRLSVAPDLFRLYSTPAATAAAALQRNNGVPVFDDEISVNPDGRSNISYVCHTLWHISRLISFWLRRSPLPFSIPCVLVQPSSVSTFFPHFLSPVVLRFFFANFDGFFFPFFPHFHIPVWEFPWRANSTLRYVPWHCHIVIMCFLFSLCFIGCRCDEAVAGVS